MSDDHMADLAEEYYDNGDWLDEQAETRACAESWGCE